MTLDEAVTKFLEHARATSTHTTGVDPSTDFLQATARHFGRDADAKTIPSDRWSDFLSTTFVEMLSDSIAAPSTDSSTPHLLPCCPCRMSTFGNERGRGWPTTPSSAS